MLDHNHPPGDPTPEEVALALRLLQLGVRPGAPDWKSDALVALERIFEEQTHPITPWFAVLWSRRHRLQTPEWVLDHFASGASAIFAATSGRHRPKNEAEAVGQALGFRASKVGGVSPMSAASRQQRSWRLAFYAAIRERVLAKSGGSVKASSVWDDVAEQEKVSRTAVRDAQNEFGAAAKAQLEALMAFFEIKD